MTPWNLVLECACALMCVCVRGVHTCDKRELQVFRRCHSAIPCLFVKDSLSFPQNLQSKLGWLASKPQRPTCLYYNAYTNSLIFFTCCFWELNMGPAACVASTFLTKPVPRPLHWKFGYPERFGVGVNLPRHTHLSWQFCPARVALPKSHGFPCGTYIQRPEPWEVTEWSRCNNSYCWGEGKWFIL